MFFFSFFFFEKIVPSSDNLIGKNHSKSIHVYTDTAITVNKIWQVKHGVQIFTSMYFGPSFSMTFMVVKLWLNYLFLFIRRAGLHSRRPMPNLCGSPNQLNSHFPAALPQPQELWFLPSELNHGSAYYFVALFSVISLLVEFLEIRYSQASY